MTDMDRETMLKRIDEIDAWFDRATSWGSWMVAMANEREQLVRQLRARWQVVVKHENLARTASGGRTS